MSLSLVLVLDSDGSVLNGRSPKHSKVTEEYQQASVLASQVASVSPLRSSSSQSSAS